MKNINKTKTFEQFINEDFKLKKSISSPPMWGNSEEAKKFIIGILIQRPDLTLDKFVELNKSTVSRMHKKGIDDFYTAVELLNIPYYQKPRVIYESLLYHSTDITNAINILKDGEIKTYENILKTSNQKPEDWYDNPEYGKYVYMSDFKHNKNNYYGLSDLDVTFIINDSTIKHEIHKADRSYEGGTISVKGNISLNAIEKVILYKINDNLIKLLNSKNIEYSIETPLDESFISSYGAEYAEIKDWAYDYAKKHAEGFNEYSDAKEYLDWFFNMIDNLPQKVELYRILQVDNKKFINKQKLGIHFTDDKSNFDDGFLQSLGFSRGEIEEKKFYIVTIQIDKELIDFENTIATRLSHPYEDEYTINKDANYKITSIEQFLPDNRINY